MLAIGLVGVLIMWQRDRESRDLKMDIDTPESPLVVPPPARSPFV